MRLRELIDMCTVRPDSAMEGWFIVPDEIHDELIATLILMGYYWSESTGITSLIFNTGGWPVLDYGDHPDFPHSALIRREYLLSDLDKMQSTNRR